jgi:hypothetical protein
MFGNFDTSWTSGFSQLNQLTESLQKIKTDIEHNLETSLGIPHLTSGGDGSVKLGEARDGQLSQAWRGVVILLRAWATDMKQKEIIADLVCAV